MDLIIDLLFGGVVILGLVLWAWSSYSEQKDRHEKNQRRSDTKRHFMHIEQLTKDGKLELAKKLIDAPKDKNGNFCDYDEATGRWLYRAKNGTWREIRP